MSMRSPVSGFTDIQTSFLLPRGNKIIKKINKKFKKLKKYAVGKKISQLKKWAKTISPFFQFSGKKFENTNDRSFERAHELTDKEPSLICLFLKNVAFY